MASIGEIKGAGEAFTGPLVNLKSDRDRPPQIAMAAGAPRTGAWIYLGARMRRLRMYWPGMSAHVVERGTIEPPVFCTRRYLLDLKELAVAARRYEVEIHAYSLSTWQ